MTEGKKMKCYHGDCPWLPKEERRAEFECEDYHICEHFVPEAEKSGGVPVESPSAGSPWDDAAPRTERSKRSGDSNTLLACSRNLEMENEELRKGLMAAKKLLDAFKVAGKLDSANDKMRRGETNETEVKE